MTKWSNDKRMDQDGSVGKGNARNTKQSHPTIRVVYPRPYQPWTVVSPLHDVEPLLLSSWLRVSLICQMDAMVSRRIALLHFIRMDCSCGLRTEEFFTAALFEHCILVDRWSFWSSAGSKFSRGTERRLPCWMTQSLV
jgi:hypothetical protein